MLKFSDLEVGDKARALSQLRSAVFHLISCWDALRELETILETEIEADQISGLASDHGDASEAYDLNEKAAAMLLDAFEEETV